MSHFFTKALFSFGGRSKVSTCTEIKTARRTSVSLVVGNRVRAFSSRTCSSPAFLPYSFVCPVYGRAGGGGAKGRKKGRIGGRLLRDSISNTEEGLANAESDADNYRIIGHLILIALKETTM